MERAGDIAGVDVGRVFFCVHDGHMARLHGFIKKSHKTRQGTGHRREAHERTETMNDIEHGTLGESFDDFLRAQGAAESATEQAIKRVIAFQMANITAQEHITKIELARRLQTSRSQIDRLLDPDNDGVQ